MKKIALFLIVALFVGSLSSFIVTNLPQQKTEYTETVPLHWKRVNIDDQVYGIAYARIVNKTDDFITDGYVGFGFYNHYTGKRFQIETMDINLIAPNDSISVECFIYDISKFNDSTVFIVDVSQESLKFKEPKTDNYGAN